jgi:hypothetical protein
VLWIRWKEIFEKFLPGLPKITTKVNVELKLNCGYLLGVCYFGLPVEPRLIFSLPLLELLLKRLKRNAKIICDGILMDMRSTATGARRSFSQESEAFSLKKPKARVQTHLTATAPAPTPQTQSTRCAHSLYIA